MKLHQLSLSIILFAMNSTSSMEFTSYEKWDNLPNTAKLQIIALCSNKSDIMLVNTQLAKLASKKNSNNLLQFPCAMSRKNHLDMLVFYAKQNNAEMIKLAIKSADLSDHKDAVEIIQYFFPSNLLIKQFSLATALHVYKQNCSAENLDILLPFIIKVYQGEKRALKMYRSHFIATPENPLFTNKKSILHIAIDSNHLAIAELLLTQDETLLNKQTFSDNLTPLHIAVMNENIPFCKFLLSFKNIKTNLHNSDIMTPLDVAASLKNKEIMELLLNHEKQKSKLQHTTSYIYQTEEQKIIGNSWKHAIENGQIDNACQLLKEINYKVPEETNPLHIAAQQENVEMVQALFELPNVQINDQDQNGNTALLIAVRTGDKNVVSYLLSKNANVNISNNIFETPLYAAVENKDINMIYLLLEKKPIIDLPNQDDITPLHRAIEKKYNTISKLLLGAGANPNTPDKNKRTPLMKAALNNNSKIIKELLKYGATPNLLDSENKSAYDMATNSKSKELLCATVNHSEKCTIS